MASAEELASFPLFDALTQSQLTAIADLSRTVTFAAGERLFYEGQDAQHCWLIRSGRVTLDTDLPGAGPLVIQTIGPGDLLGWSWLVPPYRWHFGATVSEPLVADEIDAVALRALADKDPTLGYPLVRALFRALLSRLNGTRARLLDLYGSPRDR